MEIIKKGRKYPNELQKKKVVDNLLIEWLKISKNKNLFTYTSIRLKDFTVKSS